MTNVTTWRSDNYMHRARLGLGVPNAVIAARTRGPWNWCRRLHSRRVLPRCRACTCVKSAARPGCTKNSWLHGQTVARDVQPAAFLAVDLGSPLLAAHTSLLQPKIRPKSLLSCQKSARRLSLSVQRRIASPASPAPPACVSESNFPIFLFDNGRLQVP